MNDALNTGAAMKTEPKCCEFKTHMTGLYGRSCQRNAKRQAADGKCYCEQHAKMIESRLSK